MRVQTANEMVGAIRAKVRADGFGCEVCSTSPPVVKVLGADFGRAREYVAGLAGWLRETSRFAHPVVTVHECDTCGCKGSCPWRTERKADPDAVACEACDCKWCGCRRCDEYHAHSQLRCELPDGHTLEPHRDVVGNEWGVPYARPVRTGTVVGPLLRVAGKEYACETVDSLFSINEHRCRATFLIREREFVIVHEWLSTPRSVVLVSARGAVAMLPVSVSIALLDEIPWMCRVKVDLVSERLSFGTTTQWRQEGNALVANVGKDIHAALVGNHWAVMFRGVVVARSEGDKAHAERWLGALPEVAPALTAMLNLFQFIGDAIGWRERERDAAVAKAIADVPKGCDPLRWANVVKVLAAGVVERQRNAGQFGAMFHDDVYETDARPAVREYARWRFVHRYSREEAARMTLASMGCARCKFTERLFAAYEAGR